MIAELGGRSDNTVAIGKGKTPPTWMSEVAKIFTFCSSVKVHRSNNVLIINDMFAIKCRKCQEEKCSSKVEIPENSTRTETQYLYLVISLLCYVPMESLL